MISELKIRTEKPVKWWNRLEIKLLWVESSPQLTRWLQVADPVSETLLPTDDLVVSTVIGKCRPGWINSFDKCSLPVMCLFLNTKCFKYRESFKQVLVASGRIFGLYLNRYIWLPTTSVDIYSALRSMRQWEDFLSTFEVLLSVLQTLNGQQIW
jgi:hypothetical protein